MEISKDTDQINFILLPNQETIAYRKLTNSSSKHCLIFLHGQGCSSNIFDDLLVVLNKKQDLDLYALDMRGFGDSSLLAPVESLKDIVEDIYLFIEKLSLKNVTLVGLSTGGAVAMLFAATYPDVLKSLILIDSVGAKGVPFYYEEVDSVGQKSQKMCQKKEDLNIGWGFFALSFAQKNKEFCTDFFNKTCFNAGEALSQERMDKLLDGTFKQRNFLDILWSLHIFNITDEEKNGVKGTGEIFKIKVPILIIHGDKDITVPLKEAELIYQLLGEKLVKLEIFQDCGHVPVVTESEKTAIAISNFLVGET